MLFKFSNHKINKVKKNFNDHFPCETVTDFRTTNGHESLATIFSILQYI
jgi:rRNA maturation protein Rpf1